MVNGRMIGRMVGPETTGAALPKNETSNFVRAKVQKDLARGSAKSEFRKSEISESFTLLGNDASEHRSTDGLRTNRDHFW